MNAEQIIQHLRLAKHPAEGGYFRETYRSPDSTAIYYLITPDSFSAMHRLSGDEIFHHYLGDAVEMLMLHPGAGGKSEIVRIGKNLAAGESPQVLVPARTWQGSRLLPGGSFALLGCTVAPPFEYANYQHGQRDQLIAEFPDQAEKIRALTT